MPTMLSSRDFNQDLAAAKRAAETGPVIVTDRGTPAFVLMRYEEYRQLSAQALPNILDVLAQAEVATGSDEIEFDELRIGRDIPVPPDFG